MNLLEIHQNRREGFKKKVCWKRSQKVDESQAVTGHWTSAEDSDSNSASQENT